MARTKQKKNFETMVNDQYGDKDNPKRLAFELQTYWHELSDLIKTHRLALGLTQEALAEKCGTTKHYISKVENGKSDMVLSTLYRIVEHGLGKKLVISIEEDAL